MNWKLCQNIRLKKSLFIEITKIKHKENPLVKSPTLDYSVAWLTAKGRIWRG